MIKSKEIAREDVIEDFEKFLKERRIFSTFKRSFNSQEGFKYSNYNDLLDDCYIHDFIMKSFDWSKTKKGHDYWDGVHLDWIDNSGVKWKNLDYINNLRSREEILNSEKKALETCSFAGIEEPDDGEIDNTLQERGSRYGDLIDNATISQRLKEIVRENSGWNDLTADKKEALDLIFLKISRIITGDPEYQDNWHDIIGYAKLVEDRIKEERSK